MAQAAGTERWPEKVGKTNFHTWEFSRSGSKGKEGEKIKKERERLNDGNNMAKLRMAHASTHGARKPPGPIIKKNQTLCSCYYNNMYAGFSVQI